MLFGKKPKDVVRLVGMALNKFKSTQHITTFPDLPGLESI
jgi:hypothetical protein